MKLFRYRQDVVPFILLVGLTAVQVTTFTLVDNFLYIAIVAAALILPQVSAAAANHNHQHLPFFKSKPFNRATEILFFFNTGFGPFSWVLHHTLGHHKHYLDPEKDTSKWMNKDGSTMSRIEYVLKNGIMIYPQIVKVGKVHPKLLKKFYIWFFVCAVILGVFFSIDPAKAAILFLIPMIFHVFLLVDATQDHHRGLSLDNEFEATRTRTGKLYNLYTWNLGYHAAHHSKCGVHWSELPGLHEKIKNKVPDELIST